MNIGVIGLGTIAQKAYLPIYTTQFPEHTWHFCTRDENKLRALGTKYGLEDAHLHTSWKELAAVVDAVCIHTPTQTHYKMIRFFLNRSIPVLVDKPLTEAIKETKELMQLSEESQTPLMIGFNRRFAPQVHALAQIKDKNMLIVQKNQANATDFPVRYRIYDLMIHPIDTAVFLMDDQSIRITDSEVVEENGQFKRAWAMLKSAQTTALVSVNNESGAKRETLELQGPSGTYTVENLTDLSKYSKEGKLDQSADDWTETLKKRGFQPMIKGFIDALENQLTMPVTLESALLSHEICEAIISKHEEKHTV
ncbi:MAG: Gfo/Idh/MocA family oxidoreductase [Alkalibacterium sp.]|nr:Gfo/Idh/MocA family oxidoreductase [Alkalibacterium sp.]